MSFSSLFTGIENAEHSFASWAEKELLKIEGEAPTIEKVADTVFQYVGPALQTVVTAEAGTTAGATVGAIIGKAQSTLTAASGLIADFGATPTVPSLLSDVATNLGGVLTAAGVSTKSVATVTKVVGEVNTLSTAISNAAAANAAPPAPTAA
jgi:hypothetical protein